MSKTTIKIEGKDVLIGDAIETWEEAGICRDCIKYRLQLNETFEDSYNDFALKHCGDCLC